MRSCLFVLLLPDAHCLSPTNPDLPNAKPSPLWGEGVERSETDEGDVPTSRRLNIRIGGRYPPHPSSGFRETPDATFPPRGEGSVGTLTSCLPTSLRLRLPVACFRFPDPRPFVSDCL